MKNLSLLLSFLFTITFLAAQSPEGNWSGTLEIPGMKLEMSIDIRKDGDAWEGDLDIPLQNVKDMVLADLTVKGKEVTFKLPEVPGNASYSGEIKSDNSIEGTFSQGGQKISLNWTRKTAAEAMAVKTRQQEAIATIKMLTDSFMLLRTTPGLGFGIIKDGEVLLADGFGYKDYENKIMATANTQFAIGSSTKAFTAACVAILAKEGKLEWDKPVIEYMPDFELMDEFATEEMTAVDLMCHRSGLPRHDMMWYGSRFTRKEIYDRLRHLEPNKSFRSTWQYNNLMFMTAGVLVERLSGKTWEEFLSEQLFKPLGMNNTNTSVTTMQKAPDYALPYRNEEKVVIKMDFREIDAVGPAGSINSSANDMLHWVQMQLDQGEYQGKQLIDKTDIALMHQPQMLIDEGATGKNPELTNPAYGLGWFTYNYRGIKIVEHGGNIDGFSALVYMIPEKNIGMVLLTNQNGAGINAVLARTATDLLLGLEPIDWYVRTYGTLEAEKEEKEKKKKEEDKTTPKRIEGTKLSHPITDYVGQYEHPGYGIVQIEEAAKGLVVKFNTFSMPMEQWHYDVFRAEDKALEISMMLNFETDDKGYISGFSTIAEPAVPSVVFKKLPSKSLSDPAFLEKLAGKYALDDQEMEFLVKAGKLYASIPGQPQYELEPLQKTEFQIKGLNGFSVEFVLDKKGEVKEAKFNQPNGVFTAKRAE